MKILGMTWNRPLSISPISDRWYEVNQGIEIRVTTTEGVLIYAIHQGFKFDGRSGGPFVDHIISNLGTQATAICWLVHDINFYPDTVSFNLANQMLRDMLIVCAKESRIKAKLVYRAVQWFGRSSKSDEWEGMEKKYLDNREKFSFEWSAK